MRINKTGIAIKYHGTLKLLPNQLTLQDVSKHVDSNKVIANRNFFIHAPPLQKYHITKVKVCQSVCAKRNDSKTLLEHKEKSIP